MKPTNVFARMWREIHRSFCVINRIQWAAPWKAPTSRC